MIDCAFCGYRFPASCGLYGCPNCHGEGLDGVTETIPEPKYITEWVEVSRWDCGADCGTKHKTKVSASRCIQRRTDKAHREYNNKWPIEALAQVRRAREAGATFSEIAQVHGISIGRAREVYMKADRRHRWYRKPHTREAGHDDVMRAINTDIKRMNVFERRKLAAVIDLLLA